MSLTRVNDLISQLIQIQEVLKASNQIYQIDFDEALLKLAGIRNDFERKLGKSSVKVNIVRVNNQLDIISDSLNKLIGETKIVIDNTFAKKIFENVNWNSKWNGFLVDFGYQTFFN